MNHTKTFAIPFVALVGFHTHRAALKIRIITSGTSHHQELVL